MRLTFAILYIGYGYIEYYLQVGEKQLFHHDNSDPPKFGLVDCVSSGVIALVMMCVCHLRFLKLYTTIGSFYYWPQEI